MKKLLTMALISILATSFCVGAFAGCRGKDSSNSSSNNGTFENFEPTVYKDNGEDIADYKIVISASASNSTVYGAEILQTRINQVLGVELPIVTDVAAEGELEIILGDTTRKECDEFDFDTLGSESFQVKNVDKDLVIAGNDRGLLYGVYA